MGYPKPIKAELYKTSTFLYYDDLEAALDASERAKSLWDSLDDHLKHPSYCNIGIGDYREMGDGTYCVHIP
jgi:hypothetical protein